MKAESTVALVNRLVKEPDKRHQVFTAIAELERSGYDFRDANASLELLIARTLDGKQLPFQVGPYHVSMRGSMRRGEERNHVVEASIKIWVGGAEYFEVCEGEGPVYALDGAIRQALGKSRLPSLSAVRLANYSVGLVPGITTGTSSPTRATVETTDGARTWHTMGVSGNVVEASLFALVDSLEYAFLLMARKT